MNYVVIGLPFLLAVVLLVIHSIWRDAKLLPYRKQLIVSMLQRGPCLSKHLQDELRLQGLGMSKPSFYMLMAWLEEEHIVEWWDQVEKIGGVQVSQRWYELCANANKYREGVM